MQALSTFAIEKDGGITEDIVDEVVHGRFGKLASLAASARETPGTLDLLLEEFVDVFSSSAGFLRRLRIATH